MADPVSMGAMVAVQAIGALQQGSAQSSAYKAAAAADDANAQQSLQQGAVQENEIGARLRATQGDALVAQGMSGASVGTGSALEALRQNAVNASMDVLGVRAGAASRANAYEVDAASKRAAAKNAMTAGLIGAGATALKGYAGIKDMMGPTVTAGPQLAIPQHLQSLVTPNMLVPGQIDTSGWFDPTSVNGIGGPMQLPGKRGF